MILYPEVLKAKLYNDSSIIGELDIHKTSENKFDDEYVFLEFKKISLEDHLKSDNLVVPSEIKKFQSDLCNRIIEYSYTEYIMSKKELSSKGKSLRLLIMDNNFMNLLYSIRNEFDLYINHFINLKNDDNI